MTSSRIDFRERIFYNFYGVVGWWQQGQFVAQLKIKLSSDPVMAVAVAAVAVLRCEIPEVFMSWCGEVR